MTKIEDDMSTSIEEKICVYDTTDQITPHISFKLNREKIIIFNDATDAEQLWIEIDKSDWQEVRNFIDKKLGF